MNVWDPEQRLEAYRELARQRLGESVDVHFASHFGEYEHSHGGQLTSGLASWDSAKNCFVIYLRGAMGLAEEKRLFFHELAHLRLGHVARKAATMASLAVHRALEGNQSSALKAELQLAFDKRESEADRAGAILQTAWELFDKNSW